jgi:hypothetical protein
VLLSWRIFSFAVELKYWSVRSLVLPVAGSYVYEAAEAPSGVMLPVPFKPEQIVRRFK